jgi:hypothetical protein
VTVWPDPDTYRRVCAILFDEWDPIGVNGGGPRDEYDGYAAGLIRAVLDGADEHRLTERLGRLAREAMGLSHIDTARDRRVARRLIEAVRGM